MSFICERGVYGQAERRRFEPGLPLHYPIQRLSILFALSWSMIQFDALITRDRIGQCGNQPSVVVLLLPAPARIQSAFGVGSLHDAQPIRQLLFSR